MNFIPDPLHPAVVHFPIVLILLGTCTSVVAVFWRRGYVPAMAAALLTLGALGAWVALETGESDGGLVENTAPAVEQLVEAHENWAKRTLTTTAVASVIAIVSVALVRVPRAARAIGVATVLAAAVASWTVYETGHRGGALVYHHGVGVGTSPADTFGEPSAQPGASGEYAREERDGY